MSSPEPYIEFERDGVVIISDPRGVTFKKNGLTIFIPTSILRQFAEEYEDKAVSLEGHELLNMIRNSDNEQNQQAS